MFGVQFSGIVLSSSASGSHGTCLSYHTDDFATWMFERDYFLLRKEFMSEGHEFKKYAKRVFYNENLCCWDVINISLHYELQFMQQAE